MLRFLTAGESHGQALVVIVEGVPAGLPLGVDDLSPDLARRQLGYGRGRRMAIEQDRAEILSGVRRGETLGAPIALVIRNRDWTNWQHTMSLDAEPDESLPGRAARGRHAAAAGSRGSGRRPEVRRARTCATYSSAPARARPPRESPPAPSPASSWRATAST